MEKLYQAFIKIVDEYGNGINTFTDWAKDSDEFLKNLKKKMKDTHYVLIDYKPVSVMGKYIYKKDTQ